MIPYIVASSILLVYLLGCAVARSRRLAFAVRTVAADLPMMGFHEPHEQVADVLNRTAKVDALIKDGSNKVRLATPHNYPDRQPWDTPSVLTSAITSRMETQMKDLFVGGADASLYGTLIVTDIDLSSLWQKAGAYLQEHPDAMLKAGMDLTHVILSPTPEHSARVIEHIGEVLNMPDPDIGIDEIGAVDAADAGGEIVEPDIGVPIPIFTMLRSSLRMWKALDGGHATWADAFANVALDVLGTGGGALLGATIGGAVAGPIGAFAGAIIFAIVGRIGTNQLKYQTLKDAIQAYRAKLDTVNGQRSTFVFNTYDTCSTRSHVVHDQYTAEYNDGFTPSSGTATFLALVKPTRQALLAEYVSIRVAIDQRVNEALLSHRDRWYHFLTFCNIRRSLRQRLRDMASNERAKIRALEEVIEGQESALLLIEAIRRSPSLRNGCFTEAVKTLRNEVDQYLVQHVAQFQQWIRGAAATRAALATELAKYLHERYAEYDKLASEWRRQLEPYEASVRTEAGRLGLNL